MPPPHRARGFLHVALTVCAYATVIRRFTPGTVDAETLFCRTVRAFSYRLGMTDRDTVLHVA